MLDFLRIGQRTNKKVVEVYPKFIIVKSKDLMTRGSDFYAIWDESVKLWSTDEYRAAEIIDSELDKYVKERKEDFEGQPVRVMHMWDADSGSIDRWHKFVKNQMPDFYKPLDERLIFSNDETTRESYASRRLRYPLKAGPTPAYDLLMDTLYSPDERRKIEWAIGSIVAGDSKEIQKFLVLYGSAGTGKSTVLNIIQDLFEGYYCAFDAKALGSKSDAFALEPFMDNPLVGIQHDGDLSRIEDNTRLNSLVSHEAMTINAKFKSLYSMRINAFLFMGTNKPVKITDAKSGILRRLIDVSPTGNKLSPSVYKQTMGQIKFELGAIAKKCLDIYKEDPGYYDDYVPVNMMGASNDFYNFVLDSFDIFTEANQVTLKQAWEMYKTYVDDAKVPYPLTMRSFKEELKNYFENFEERAFVDDASYRNLYSGFKKTIFLYQPSEAPAKKIAGLKFEEQDSLLDDMLSGCKAQYGSDDETPQFKWDNVNTVLADLDTHKLHYVRVPKNHIVIDFDIKDKDGKKSFKKNVEAANKWPRTYAELSKSGEGIHLHYIYDGDVSQLARLYDDDIEIKVFTGKSSLRRKLTRCNNIPVATINSGLPIKGETKMVNFESLANEKALRTVIAKNLRKEYHGATKPSIDFIFDALERAYAQGMKYDVTDMRPSIMAFATGSTHQAEYCMKKVMQMKFKSDEPSESVEAAGDKLIFYDVEIYPNLFLLVWKEEGKDPVVMYNPSANDIEQLIKYKLVGFNCRRYDNHILYARMIGHNNAQLYEDSQRIIGKSRNAFFGEAYNLSYTDVYDFCSKKQSLKKWEIELGIHHQEMGLPWDKPVPEELWPKVAEYCINDVVATEAVFNARKEDFIAREMLAKLSGLTVNDTTNSHTMQIIFGSDKNPQSKFVYTDLSTIFPGYTFDKFKKKSMYRDEDPGEGGYVYSEPGMYTDVVVLDIASMHPHSIKALNLFGPYTDRFYDLVRARIFIKHGDYESAGKMFSGKLAPYLKSKDEADALSYALKIAINSVYGLTSASFDNRCKDPRNIDNIVAKRGALFMINLKHEVQERGFTVAHIKTDSIKIPNATREIIDFVTEYGKQYGYSFEHEATYDRMCLVNDAVYIAKYASIDKCYELYGKDYVDSVFDICKDNKKHGGQWTATGTQFQVPYVFKTLFSKEQIELSDVCETKTVETALYLDMNENLPEGEHNYQFVGKAGQFCPIKPGCGGGVLLREKDGKYNAATGTKGFRWLESEVVKNLGKDQDVDLRYYEKLCEEAIASISEYGDYEWFVS